MTKVAQAENRLFKNIYICRRCKNKIRAPVMKVLRNKIKCRTCNNKALRPKRKK